MVVAAVILVALALLGALILLGMVWWKLNAMERRLRALVPDSQVPE